MSRPAADPDRLRSHVEALAGPRHPRTDPLGLAAAEDHVAGALEATGLTVERSPFRHGGETYRNVVGRRRGEREGAPRVLLGAHFDAAAGTPGADDNASGVAVLLETARMLAGLRPDVPLEFVGFNLEEPQGFMDHRIGSRHYAREARRRGVRYRACLVLEMVGYTGREGEGQSVPPLLFWKAVPDEPDFLAVVGDWRSRHLVDRFREAASSSAPGLRTLGYRSPLRGWLLPVTRLSDHSRFWDEGYPALMLTDTAFLRNPNYHRPTDRPDTLDYEFMRRVAEATAGAVERLSARP